MEIEEILNCFNHPNGRFPTEALNAAQEKQEQIMPRLLSIVEDVVSNYRNVSADQMDYIFALYLLSKFREKRAFPHILALASLPEEWPEELLGDCITEALASFIVSTFNGDLSSIKKLIEDETLNEWSRNAGLNSLLGLVALEKLQRENLIDYLRFLFHSPLPDNEEFVTYLVNTASDLYPEELMDESNKAFDKDKFDTFCINKKWITRVLEQGKQKSLSDNVYNDHFHLPIDDVEKKCLGWPHFTLNRKRNRVIT